MSLVASVLRHPLFGACSRFICLRSFKDEPLPVDGYVTLSDKPGFGLELNREANKLTRPFPRLARDFATIEAEKAAEMEAAGGAGAE